MARTHLICKNVFISFIEKVITCFLQMKLILKVIWAYVFVFPLILNYSLFKTYLIENFILYCLIFKYRLINPIISIFI